MGSREQKSLARLGAELERLADELVRLGGEAQADRPPAERFLALSVADARRTLYISNSYFVPGENFMNLLLAAAKRGVDVRVLTVSNKTDVKTTWYAGRTYYEKLLEGGVKIYEYQPTMMHAKTMVVDGIWSDIG